MPLLFFACGAFLACGEGPADEPVPDEAPVEAWLAELIESAEVPGVALATVGPDGTIETTAVGVANRATGASVTAQTVFEAASLSKPVTAYGALRMVDDGRLDLDMPLAEIVDVIAFADGLDDARLRTITPRHVLRHASGLPNWRRGGAPELRFDPGTDFGYSGEGYVLLGRALEALSGKPLDRYLDDAVLSPLGMTDSAFVWRPEFGTVSAVGHGVLGEVQEKRRPDEANAAASLHTTAGDYARFLREMLQPTLVSDALVAEMTTPSTAVADDLAWGLGWGLETVGSPMLWHWGDNGVFRCFAAASPEHGEGVVYFTNSENGLALVRQVLHSTLGPGEHPAIDWAGYPQVEDGAFRVQRDLLRAGLDDGADAVREADRALQAEVPEAAANEGLYNRLGYALLQRDAFDAAIEVFALNVERHPESANVYDSLGEGYLRRAEAATPATRADDVARSQAAYERSIELEPGNTNARTMLERLAALDIEP